MLNVSDQDILHSLKQDKSAGMRLLFDKYYTLLVTYAEQLLRDRHQAEDVVQEFYIRLWRDDYLGKATIRALPAYLYTGVRNSCITCHARKDSLRDPVALTAIEIPVESFLDITDERVERVMRAIERLPERTRQVVEGVMLEGHKYKEVAGDLSISVNTVKFLLKEGTRHLRESLSTGTRKILLLLFRKKTR
jgi:RNA polymerase sigma-70 factor (ECF subfamily)